MLKFLNNFITKEETACERFSAAVKGFLGNNKTENYMELVDAPVKSYGEIGCRMSLKVHILHAHLENLRRIWEHIQNKERVLTKI